MMALAANEVLQCRFVMKKHRENIGAEGTFSCWALMSAILS